MSIELVGASFLQDDGEWSFKEYHYLNKFEIPLKIGNYVEVKVGTGGSERLLLRSIQNISKEEAKEKYKGYKNILENLNLKRLEKPPLEDGNSYVYDIRIWRNQWSDLVKTCIAEDDINFKDRIMHETSEGNIVNIRQMPTNEIGKKDTIYKIEKKSLIGKIRGLFG